MVILIALLVIGWVAAAVVGTMAYFLGEQTKPIHGRNWNNDDFAALSESVTAHEMNYAERVPAYVYSSNQI